jgi:hypothetical protein
LDLLTHEQPHAQLRAVHPACPLLSAQHYWYG